MVRLLSLVNNYRDISITVFFLLLSVVLMAVPASLKINSVKKFNRFVLSPMQWSIAYLASLNDMEEEIICLRATNNELALELSRSRDLIEENKRLKSLLEFTREKGIEFLPSRVVSISLDEPLTTVLIDKGSIDGVTIYSPIMTTDGLVGKILEVDKYTSLAELYTHPQFRAAAVVHEKSEMGILRSTGSTLLLTGLSMNTEIEQGDRVVTSGLGGVYPEGIPIGRVTSVVEDHIGIEKVANVEPYVSLSGLFEVAVLLDQTYIDSDTTMLRRAKGSLKWLWEARDNREGGQ